MAEAAQARKRQESKHSIPSGAEVIETFLWPSRSAQWKFVLSSSFEASRSLRTGPDSKVMLFFSDARKQLDDICVKLGIECSPPRTASRLLDKVLSLGCYA